MTPALQQIKTLDAEASFLTRRIRDLRGVTPEFEVAARKAQVALEQHLCLIDSEEASLRSLRQQAAFIASHIGASEYPPTVEPEIALMPEPEPAPAPNTEVELDEIALFEPAEIEPVLDPWAELPQEHSFETIGEVAEQIIGALEQIADEPPVTEDASDAPEMTHEEIEAYEMSVREADRVAAE
jgi:hypothetical protein